MYGADTRQLRELATSFANTARALRDSSGALSSTVTNTLWRGGDADQFKNRWQSVHRARMDSAATTIDEAAATLRRNADEQDRASGLVDDGGDIRQIGLPSAEDVRGFVHDASPAEIRDWWSGLTLQQQQYLEESNPELLANTDGIPPEIRYSANRARLESYVQSLKLERARLAERLDNPLEWVGDPMTRSVISTQVRTLDEQIEKLESLASESHQILLFDPAGDGRIAEVFGDLSTANDVAVVVPGVSNDLSNYSSDNAQSIYEGAGGDDGTTATIQWLGYDTPEGIHDPAALTDQRAYESARHLVSVTDGLKATGAAEVSVVAHSYGTLVATEAAQEGMVVNRVILLGSPGVHADDVSVYNGADVYAGSNSGDPIQHADHIGGNDPTTAEFGAETLPGDWDWPWSAHSTYFDPDSASLDGIVQAIESPHVRSDGMTVTRTVDADGNAVDTIVATY